MGNIGLYGSVQTETCNNVNGNDIVIKWVLCPIVMAMATTLKLKLEPESLT